MVQDINIDVMKCTSQMGSCWKWKKYGCCSTLFFIVLDNVSNVMWNSLGLREDSKKIDVGKATKKLKSQKKWLKR